MTIEMRCSCMSEDAKWELQGVLNTVRLLAENNLQRTEEDIKREGEKPYFIMAREKLKGDLETIRTLKVLIDKVPLCELKRR